MKIAHIIPPRALEHVSDLLGDYHLLLPSLMGSEPYRDEYRTRTSLNNYYILDNGIAEGRAVDFIHQLAMARVIGAQEVILPDVMKDMDGTLRAVAQAFYPAFEHRSRYQFMFVCQGKNISECVHSAIRAMNLYPGIIGSFGIPRHTLSNGFRARVTIATRLSLEFPHKPIHLLGTHPEYSNELMELASHLSTIGVRGADTSLAWNATQAELPVDLARGTIVERQPIDEFKKASFDHAAPSYIKLLRDNIEAMNSWVK
jgi:hypothetical protein